MSEMKKFTGESTIDDTIRHLDKVNNDSFQLYNYYNLVCNESEITNQLIKKSTKNINYDVERNDEIENSLQTQIGVLKATLNDEINLTLKRKNELEMLELNVKGHLQALMNVVEEIDCDLRPLRKHLGDYQVITSVNLDEFLLTIEKRMNTLLTFVYCNERDGMDIQTVDDNLIVRSLKRDDDDDDAIVKIEDVVISHQCPECAEAEDVNRYDDKIEHVMSDAELHEFVKRKVEMPEIVTRMHSLSACFLPRSGIIASRRYAE
jgi:hypothetical protein